MLIKTALSADLSRRKFLAISGGTVAALSGPLGIFNRAAHAAPAGERILVLVQLFGGNDGVNTLIPYADPNYTVLRPNIALTENELAATKLNDQLAYHPALAPMYNMYQNGWVCNLQGVGYEKSSRSHFFSEDVWRTASRDPFLVDGGWVAKFYENGCTTGAPESVLGIRKLDRALVSRLYSAASLTSLESFGFSESGSNPRLTTKYIERIYTHDGPEDSNLDFVVQIGRQTQQVIENLGSAANYVSQRTYPDNSFGNDLQTVAKIINSGLPVRVFHTGFSGFDTHSGQLARHVTLLDRLSSALEVFYQDLQDNNRHQDVLVMTITEFGRRVKENASGGTDHGSGNVQFILGLGLAGGVLGPVPNLDPDQLYRGDVPYAIDFRGVYAEVLDRWLGCSSADVLGAEYAHPGIFGQTIPQVESLQRAVGGLR